MTKDGKSLLIPLFDGTRKPGDLKARATTILARLSPTYVMQVIEPSLAEIREERYPVRNVKAGPDEGSAATLSYDVAIFHVTLWYDPRTLLPTRRVTKSDHGDVVTETYSEMTVDAELPDELFRMPEEKK
jgi:hypothetical protein